MKNLTPIAFFTDDIEITPHSASADLGKAIGKPMTIREFAETVGQPVSLGKTDNGELYAAAGRYPNIVFIEGPETIRGLQAA